MLTKYYQKNPKEMLQKKARESYQNLSEGEKNIGINMLANNIEIFPNK